MIRQALIEALEITQMLPNGGGAIAAVRGVSLSLYRGDLTLLSGPSGSGKTTLLSILGCLRTPTKGSLTVMGEALAGYGPDALARIRRAHIGFVFQSYNLFPILSARENLRLALDAREWIGDDHAETVRQALDAVGLSGRADARPAAMSGGEQQRLAIARAVVSGAPIILADEPTSALDSRNGQIVMGLLADLAHARGGTVLVVTHDPRIEHHADRIVRIEDGRIVDDVRPLAPGASMIEVRPVS
jgi:putative ABC transport system ATP-binding protein